MAPSDPPTAPVKSPVPLKARPIHHPPTRRSAAAINLDQR